MTFQHEGVDATLFVGDWSEGNGARDVRRAVHILCSAIEQQQTFRFQRNVRLWRRLVMHDGAMSLIARNGVERKALIQGLLGTQGSEFLVDAHLRLTTSLNGRLQPFQEPHHCNAVLQHRRPETRNLRLVLNASGDCIRGER